MTKLKYVITIPNRHGGAPFHYFRFRRELMRLHGEPGSSQFMTRYEGLLARVKELKAELPSPIAHRQSLRDLPERERLSASFRLYCERAAIGAHGRAKKANVPCTIDDRDVAQLLINQHYRCAVSGLALVPSPDHPYRPSLDRIIPNEGYIPGNIRIVCMMVNQGLGHWGLKDFLTVVAATHRRNLE
jgi:hypothetical protein